ncbi:hypothetical protein C8F01DRAFT_634550 [Mycena amicta]|nr:hypothetical protein C8F01DRAFT_634550 [Mycena amicta]
MQRSSIFIVLSLCLGLVRGATTQQNVTVDDTSPDIIYGGKTFQCNSASPCPDGLPDGTFNESVTLTSGSISFSFTGTAIYMALDLIGVASVTLDGKQVANLNVSLAEVLANEPGDESGSFLEFGNLDNVLHQVNVEPQTPLTIIGFDHLIYTAILPGKKSHVGAIVGGVIGGLALITAMLFAGLFAHRRKLIVRRNQRKSAVLRGLNANSARGDYKAGVEHGTEVPA